MSTGWSSPAVGRDAATFEAGAALRDVQAAAAEYGLQVVFQTINEAGVERSKYNSVKSRALTPTVTMYANEVQYSPSKYQLEKLGFRSETQIVVYTPMQSWIDAKLGIADIDMIRWRMFVDAAEGFEISDKRVWDQFGLTHLYIVLGGKCLG